MKRAGTLCLGDSVETIFLEDVHKLSEAAANLGSCALRGELSGSPAKDLIGENRQAQCEAGEPGHPSGDFRLVAYLLLVRFTQEDATDPLTAAVPNSGSCPNRAGHVLDC
jgi:hypothetical protein